MPKKVVDPDLAEEIIDRNVKAVERIAVELFGAGRVAIAGELALDDYIEHGAVPPGWPTGRSGLVAYVELMRSAFPDLGVDVINKFGEGDRVVIHVAYSGTHLGEFMDIPASGKSVRWEEMHICRMEDGRLAEHWEASDLMGLIQQISPRPAPN